MARIFVRFASLALLASALATPVRADDLDTFKAKQQIAVQKWTRDVAASLDVARTLPAAEGRALLQSTLARLKTTSDLPDAARADLARQLEGRLRDTSAAPIVGTPPAAPRTQFAQDFAKPKPAAPPASSVSDTAKSLYERQLGQIKGATQSTQNRAAGFNNAIGGVTASSIPSDQAITLAPNHKDLIAKRTPPVNAKDEAVMKGLSTVVSGDLTGMNLRQVLDMLSEKAGVPILPEAGSLKELGVDLEDPVQFKTSAKVTVRTVLRKVLGDRGLAYIVADGSISVVTLERARAATVVRVYPVGDLVSPIRPQPQVVYNPLTGGFVPAPPGLFPTQNQVMGQTIVDLVKASVDPSYWAPTGPGSVTFHEATGTILVRASAEIHWLVNNALYRR